MKERFIVYIGESTVKRFENWIEARAYAKTISERDERVVTVVDTFTGEETVYREFSFWF